MEQELFATLDGGVAELVAAIEDEEGLSATVGNGTVIVGQYAGGETQSIRVDVDNDSRTITARLKPQQYGTHYDLPNQGDPAILYVATEEAAVYRWDEAQLKYYCVGRDYEQIKTIYGGSAENGE